MFCHREFLNVHSIPHYYLGIFHNGFVTSTANCFSNLRFNAVELETCIHIVVLNNLLVVKSIMLFILSQEPLPRLNAE